MTRILIVEDSRTQAQELQLLLSARGYEVVLARDGVEGVETARRLRPDLVLSDVVMPRMDGYGLCRALKADPELSAIPVVLLTSLRDPTDILAGLECGADNFITKPFDDAYLVRRLEHVLINRRMREEQRVSVGVELMIMGRRYTVDADRQQILDLLVSTFDEVLRAREKEIEARLATRTLERSHRFLQSIVDALPSLVAIVDPDGRLVFANEAWQQFTEDWEHTAPDRRAGLPELLAPLAPPDELADLEGGLGALFAGRVESHRQELTLAFGGARAIHQVTATRLNNESGEPRVLLALEDVTAQRLAARRASVEHRVTRILAGSETLSAAAAALLPELGGTFGFDGCELWVLGGNGCLTCAEAWYTPALGETPFAARASTFEIPAGMGLAGPLDGMQDVRWWDDLRRESGLVRQQEAVDADVRGAVLLPIRVDGHPSAGLLLVRRHATPRCDDQDLETLTAIGSQLGQFLERRRAQERLMEREQRLRDVQKMEAIGRLAGGVAHDFNNLLSVILAYTDLLRTSLPAGSESAEDVLEIRRAAESGTELTRQLLALGRRQVLQPEPLDLNVALRDIARMVDRVIGDDVTLRLITAPDLGAACLDRSRVEQIAMNLAVNARDAMPQGGTLTIETANLELDGDAASQHPGTAPGRYVALYITDTGIGMDAATRARAFEPFYTTKDDGKGTGLGLSIVHGIVEQSGGHVQVESAPGRGTTFRVLFPRVDDAPDRAEPDAPPSIRRLSGPARILLVDDEPSVRAATRRMLSARGHDVVLADDAATAIAAIRRAPDDFDVLVTDIVMPGTSGCELAEAARELRPDLPVLLLSGYAPEVVSDQGMFPERAVFLEKPFTTEGLVRALEQTLSGASP